MDLTESIAPKSDQINAEDLLTGPRTFTIERVSAGSDEQPVDVHLVELPGRPYRPSKSMRRVMVAAWGAEASAYAGRRLTLYRDAEVTFGRDKVGGIKISHLSHIEKRMALALTVTRGKRAPHVVEPLPDVAPPAPEPTAEQVVACTDRDELKGWWRASGPERRAQIQERVADLDAAPAYPTANSTLADEYPEDLLGGTDPERAA
jgi:hypothetical protein